MQVLTLAALAASLLCINIFTAQMAADLATSEDQELTLASLNRLGGYQFLAFQIQQTQIDDNSGYFSRLGSLPQLQEIVQRQEGGCLHLK